MEQSRVAWISIAPVKALALVELDEARLEPEGVPGDRAFYVVDARGRLTNGKRLGELVQVHPAWDPAEGGLALRFPDGAEVAGTVALGERLVTLFYGRPVFGRVVEGPWSSALSDFAGEPLRLVAPERRGSGVDRERIGAVSLLSRAALANVARAAGADTPLDPRRFRMTLGIDGVPAHAEDGWLGRDVRVGEAVVRPLGHVGRCLVTSQDPQTGRRDMDTLGALRAYRGALASTEPLPFGVHGAVTRPGRVRVGDPVEAIGAPAGALSR